MKLLKVALEQQRFDLAPSRLHRIIDGEIIVMFAKDENGRPTANYVCTVNNSDSQALNNFRNIDRGFIKARPLPPSARRGETNDTP